MSSTYPEVRSSPAGVPAAQGRPRRAAPSLPDIFFIMLALAIPLRWHHPLLNADGDLAIHLRMGHLILREHAVPFVDRFSFTMAGQPLIPTAWLSEVLYAAAESLGGLPAVVLFVGLVLALTYALVALFLRRRGVDPRIAVLACLFSVLLGAIHWLPRPHLFTILGSVVLLMLLERGDRQSLWPYGLLFALWSNLHGGFIYGLIILTAYTAGELFEAFSSQPEVLDARAAPRWKARALRHGIALAIAAVASLLNPGGLLLLRQIGASLGSSHMVDTTVEYRSPNFHLMGPQFFLLVLLLALLLLGRGRRRMPWPWLAVVLVNLGFALFSVRNIPLFGVTALPLLTLHASRMLHRWREGYIFGDGFAAIDRQARVGVWSAPVLALILGLAVAHGRVAGVQTLPTSFSPEHFPVEAVRDARTAGLEGNLFSEFIYAGYVIYAWPGQRVFASSQKYTDAVSRDYLDVYYLAPGWRAILDRWNVQLVLLPRETPLANELQREPGWAAWHCDDTAVLLVRATNPRARPRPVPCPRLDPAARHADRRR